MKNILQIILITFFTFAISSCAKKDDSKTATAIPATGTGTTASGTISGAGQEWTGLYNMSWSGAEPSGGCIDNSTALTLMSVPTGTAAFKKQIIITSSTKITLSLQWYSDTTCSTITGYFNAGYTGITLGGTATGLTAGSNPTKPTSALQMNYTEEVYGMMANTAGTMAYFTTIGLSSYMTSGTEFTMEASSPTTYYTLITHGTQSGSDSTYLFFGDAGSSYPTDWSSNDTVYWK